MFKPLLLVSLVALPAVAALLAALTRRPDAQRARIGAGAAGIALAAALALAVLIAADGPISATAGGTGIGLWADRLTAVLLPLIFGVSAVVQSFAGRYLRGDACAGRFFTATGLLTSATAALVAAATLVGLALAWTLAGAAFCLLLALYPQLDAAREGVRRTTQALLIGDGALWAGVLVATLTWGRIDLYGLGARAPQLAQRPALLALVAGLVVVAACARSAQLPLQRWLPATLAAPTPVSALLHAGVVNAGGILLVRLSPLFGASRAATWLAFAAGAATLVYGTTLMLTKPDVKGALAHSTMGQMGFMVMTCGVGGFAAAIFHLVAHGMYKAALFLGSGSAVGRHVGERKAPPAPPASRTRRRAAAAFALLVPAGVLLVAPALLHPTSDQQTSTRLLLAFAWATAAAATWGWLLRHPTTRGALAALAALLVLAPAYVLVAGAFTSFLAPALAGAGNATVAPALIAPVLAVLVAANALRLLGHHARLAELHRTLYVLALGAGQVRSGARRPRLSRRSAALVPAGGLLAHFEGGRL